MKIKAAFSAVEVLFSLIIVTIFVMAGFQLYQISNQSNLLSRGRAIASNVTYNHLRHVANKSTIDDCPDPALGAPALQAETPFEGEYLPQLSITSLISSPYADCTQHILKIEVTTKYNLTGTQQTEKQILYVQK